MPDHVLDAMSCAYADWFDEAEEVRSAYRRWRSAEQAGAAGAFIGYTVALEREERAAHAYARQVVRASRYMVRNLRAAVARHEAAAS